MSGLATKKDLLKIGNRINKIEREQKELVNIKINQTNKIYSIADDVARIDGILHQRIKEVFLRLDSLEKIIPLTGKEEINKIELDLISIQKTLRDRLEPFDIEPMQYQLDKILQDPIEKNIIQNIQELRRNKLDRENKKHSYRTKNK